MLYLRRMNPVLVLASLLVLVSTAWVSAQSREERAVRALIDTLVRAENSVDPAVVNSALAAVSPTGGPLYDSFRGPSLSLVELKAEVDSRLPMIASRRFSISSPLSIHMDRDSAWTSFDWEAQITWKDGGQQSLNGRATLVFGKERNDWKLTHFHSSLPARLPPSKASMEADAKAILEQEQSLWSAFRDKQLEAVDSMLVENFSALGPDQVYRVQGKAAYLGTVQEWMSGNELRSFQLLDPKVEILGDTALLTYYYSYSGSSGGHPISSSGKMTSVYVRQDGQWRLLHYHESANPGARPGTPAKAQ